MQQGIFSIYIYFEQGKKNDNKLHDWLWVMFSQKDRYQCHVMTERIHERNFRLSENKR